MLRAKDLFDQNVSNNQPSQQIGDKVFIKESIGSFQILEMYTNSVILINLKTNQRSKVNLDRIKCEH